MHTTTERRKSLSDGFTIRIAPPPQGNMLSIQAQIMLKSRAKQHNKRNSRAKQQRQWRKEM